MVMGLSKVLQRTSRVVLGVFSLLAGALIAFELFISPAASCVK
jgi:hypothetical protein